MNRLTSTFATLVAAAALAACGGSHHASTPKGGPGATVTIDLGAPDEQFGVPGFDDHGALPAISEDGTLVAALFHDSTDFVGMPVDTVVVWKIADGSRVGEAASSDGQPPDGDAPVEVDPALVAELTSRFSAREVVVLASTIAQVNFWTRFNQGLGVPAAGFFDERACALPERFRAPKG